MPAFATSDDWITAYCSGPFKYGDEYAYALLLWRSDYSWSSGSNGFRMYKGWHSVADWVPLDSDNTPTLGRVQDSCYDGSRYVYVLTYDDKGGTANLRLQKFDLETETWVMIDKLIKSQSQFPQWFVESEIGRGAIDIDSNGKLYVTYNYYSTKGYHRIYWAYSTNSGSSWTVDQTISTGVGSKVTEYGFNVHAHGTNIYFWYNWNDGADQILRCKVYNGTGWSAESTVTPYATRTFCRGRPVEWVSSGSPLLTHMFVPNAEAVTVNASADTSTGSQPNWGNVLSLGNQLYPLGYYNIGLYNGKPFHLTTSYTGYPNDPARDIRGIPRTSYSAWGSLTLLYTSGSYFFHPAIANPNNNNDFVFLGYCFATPNAYSVTGYYDTAPYRANQGGPYYFIL